MTRIETTTPLWRLVSVAAACGAVAALAYYLNAVHHADDFATVAVITVAYTITFWAAKRPQQFAVRFGPFGKIAAAVRESQDDLRTWVIAKPLKAGAMIAACYGIAVVLAKHLVMIILAGLWNPWLAVAVGAAIGAVVTAPHMFAALARRITNGDRSVTSGTITPQQKIASTVALLRLRGLICGLRRQHDTDPTGEYFALTPADDDNRLPAQFITIEYVAVGLNVTSCSRVSTVGQKWTGRLTP